MPTEILNLKIPAQVPVKTTVEVITDRYIELGESFHRLFLAMGERSELEGWRFDGVGSCRGVDSSVAYIGLEESPARKRIHELQREAYYRHKSEFGIKEAGDFRDRICSNHSKDFGCVLGVVKSPYCMAHMEFPHELKNRFKINGKQLGLDIPAIFRVTLTQDTSESEDSILSTLTPDEYHQLALEAISGMTEYVKRFPILRDEERTQLNRYRRSEREL